MRPRVEPTLLELLLLECRAGSESAFEELYRRFEGRLRAHVAHLLGGTLRERVDDVCQEVWLAIVRGLAGLADPGSFRAWAYAIATRRVADLHRRHGKEPANSAEPVSELPDDRAPSEAASDRRELLQQALRRLPSTDRVLLRLFYLDELSVAEVAAALTIPAGTVKSRLFHARRRLQKALHRSVT